MANKVVRPKGMLRDKKDPKVKKMTKKIVPNMQGKVKPAPMRFKGKLVYGK